MRARFIMLILITVSILGGCAPQIREPVLVCPGVESSEELLAVLRGHSENLVSLRASGQCLLEYYVDGEKRRENFPVKLWVNLPGEIYLQGDVAFDPRGIVVGANEEEFWLSVKPKEISGYWWGRWADTDHLRGVMINPAMILEAFGGVDVGGGGNWVLSKEGDFDILTRREGRDDRRKLYISDCDYLIRKIEYLNTDGETAAVVKLGKYKRVGEGSLVPGVMEAVNYNANGEKSRLRISFGSIRPVNFTEKQRHRFFTRPEPRGFKHIYKVVGDNVIEQL